MVYSKLKCLSILILGVFLLCFMEFMALAETSEYHINSFTDQPRSFTQLNKGDIRPSPRADTDCSATTDFYGINAGEQINLYASNLFNPKKAESNLTQSNTNNDGFKIDYGKFHKYLGYGTLLLGGIAAVSGADRSGHYAAAYSAAGTALASCFTGYIEYSDRFDLDEGIFSEDNLHIILGTLGTIAWAAAIAVADSDGESGHAGAGITGGSTMLISVVVIKW